MAALAAFVLAVGVVGLVMLRGPGYSVAVTVPNAGQLVKGNQVKVGGVPVGTVDAIELTPDGQARIELGIDDGGLAPLHRGTKAIIRATSLGGIANRYISLQPGPNNAPAIADGGSIPAEDVKPIVDLDAVLNALGPAARHDLSRLVRSAAGAFDGAEREANAGLRMLNPAVSQASLTARELMRDEKSFERFIVEAATVVDAVTKPRADLEQVVGNAAGAAAAIAREDAALDTTLEQLPPTLRRVNTSLVNVRGTLRDLRPALVDARPAAPLLSRTLERLAPIARRALPLVARTRKVVDAPGTAADLLGVVRGFPGLAERAVPAFESADQTVKDALPIVRDARPYTPDVVGGLINGFGGTTTGYYDANGHYARISFHSSVYSADGLGSLIPFPPSQQGLTGYRKRVIRRCPGGGVQPHPDKSSPFVEREDFPCDRGDTLR